MNLNYNGQCDTCARPLMQDGFAAGYARDDLGRKHCYTCCADHDLACMHANGKITLYLSLAPTADTSGRAMSTQEHDSARKDWRVSNWPGTLNICPTMVRKGRHNLAGTRYDVYFRVQGRDWHGVQYGENTQLLHCKRLKGA